MERIDWVRNNLNAEWDLWDQMVLAILELPRPEAEKLMKEVLESRVAMKAAGGGGPMVALLDGCHMAAANGIDLAIVSTIAVDNLGFLLDAGEAPVGWAVYHATQLPGRYEIQQPLRLLAGAGAPLDFPNGRGMTPLQMAAEEGWTATVELLLELDPTLASRLGSESFVVCVDDAPFTLMAMNGGQIWPSVLAELQGNLRLAFLLRRAELAAGATTPPLLWERYDGVKAEGLGSLCHDDAGENWWWGETPDRQHPDPEACVEQAGGVPILQRQRSWRWHINWEIAGSRRRNVRRGSVVWVVYDEGGREIISTSQRDFSLSLRNPWAAERKIAW